MPAITKKESISFNDLYKKSYVYLSENFHKFSQRNKIQVAIAVCKMAVPQKIEHSGSMTVEMPVIRLSVNGEASSEPMNPLEFNIGTPRLTRDTEFTTEAPPRN